jgi:hypothetical protein
MDPGWYLPASNYRDAGDVVPPASPVAFPAPACDGGRRAARYLRSIQMTSTMSTISTTVPMPIYTARSLWLEEELFCTARSGTG